MDFKAVVNWFINPLKCVLPLEVKLSGKACLKCEERQLERHWRCGWARVSSRTLKSVGPGVGDPICNQNFGALDKDKIFCSPLLQLHGVGTGWVIILLPFSPPAGVSHHASENNPTIPRAWSYIWEKAYEHYGPLAGLRFLGEGQNSCLVVLLLSVAFC